MRVIVLVLGLVSVFLAGCVSPPQALDPTNGPVPTPAVDLSDLVAQDATQTLDANGVRTFVFEGASELGARGILVGTPPLWQWETAVPVDNRVGWVAVELNYTAGGDNNLIVFVVDDLGRIQCGGAGFQAPKGCTAPVPSNATSKKAWTLRVLTGFPFSEPGIPFTVTAALHPLTHLQLADPLAGVDTAIKFRLSDTKVQGSEPNVGVLSDGTIFAQESLQTLRSRDDGVTWESVAPPATSVTTLDPMLFVDPWSDTVYVDQLYVACSVLAWSTDAGESWITNPAACGNPGDDHQKVAAGPNPLPLPFNAVYYAHSSFVDGVFVSHSYDGGITWVTAPVVGVTDDRVYDNTGHVFADREGNVYDPMYMCDNGGYMGVGVSNDYGRTFAFVVVDEEKGGPTDNGCYDPDPGLWSDTDGVVYMAYHRPSGIKYTYSLDHGKTWAPAIVVSPPGQKSWAHVDAVAGDPGRLAIVYRATSDSAKGPNEADGYAAWYLYVTFVENATSATPTVRTALVSPPGDPEQRGQVCTSGIACVGGSRNLLDFIDIAVGPDGRVYTVYTDGCNQVCETPADSRARLAMVGILEDGPRLFADKAPWAKAAGSRKLLGLV